MTQSSRSVRGFTLIELLVVISIISLLSSVVLASLSGVRKSSDDAVKVLEVKQFITALDLFYDTYKYYPTPSYSGSESDQEAAIGYNLYSTCLQLNNLTEKLCTFRNHNYIDDTFNATLAPFMQTQIKPSLPVMVYYPNKNNTYDVGGIEYDCTDSVYGQTHAYGGVRGNCQSYMLTWIYQGNNKQNMCAGGIEKKTAPGARGYQNTNTTCTYTNNPEFRDAFWSDPDLPSPSF